LSGHYAIRIERSRGITELMCAFEEERDADEAARTVGAAKTAPYPESHTQRSFVLDGQKLTSFRCLLESIGTAPDGPTGLDVAPSVDGP
jgi:hypothetical protein